MLSWQTPNALIIAIFHRVISVSFELFFWEPLYFRKCLVHCRDDHLDNVCVIFRRLFHLYRAGFRGYSSKYQEAFGIFWVLILYGG